MADTPIPGHRTRDHRSDFGARKRSSGGEDSAHPVFQPSNDGVTQSCLYPWCLFGLGGGRMWNLIPTKAVRLHSPTEVPGPPPCYGHGRAQVEKPRLSSTTKSSAPSTNPHRHEGFWVTVTSRRSAYHNHSPLPLTNPDKTDLPTMMVTPR